MRCVKPIPAFLLAGRLTKNGKPSVVFRKPESNVKYESIVVPCDRCIKCRLRRSVAWAIRLQHEAQMHDRSSFLTLTYDDEHLPYGGTLVKRHHQDFIRSLRKRVRREYGGKKIRFFVCGEYGGQFGRPHLHVIIFGFDFPDRKLFTSSGGKPLYESELLAKCWPHGQATIGRVSADSCSYVSGYVVKKLNGDMAEEVDPVTGLRPYESFVEETGEIVRRIPEYANMSLKPGIGATWFERFNADVYPHDSVVRKGKEISPPKFYDRLLERESEARYADVLARRKSFALEHKDFLELSPQRLKAAEINAVARQELGRGIGPGRFRDFPGVTARDLSRQFALSSARGGR